MARPTKLTEERADDLVVLLAARVPVAEVAELLGDSKRVAADHYVYALTDYREIDRSLALARAR